MAEALITRRGGTVKFGTITEMSQTELFSEDFIGAKNILITLCCENANASVSSGEIAAAITIVDGNKVSAIRLGSDKLVDSRGYITFDSTTGKITSTNLSYIDFKPTGYGDVGYYSYVAW